MRCSFSLLAFALITTFQAQADLRDSSVEEIVMKEVRISRYRQIEFFRKLETIFDGKYVRSAAEFYERQQCPLTDSTTSAYVYGKDKEQSQKAISFLQVDGFSDEVYYCDTEKTFMSYYVPIELQQVLVEEKGGVRYVTACRFSRVDVSESNPYAFHQNVTEDYGHWDFSIHFIPVTACITQIRSPGKPAKYTSTNAKAMLLHPAALRFWKLNNFELPKYLKEFSN